MSKIFDKICRKMRTSECGWPLITENDYCIKIIRKRAISIDVRVDKLVTRMEVLVKEYTGSGYKILKKQLIPTSQLNDWIDETAKLVKEAIQHPEREMDSRYKPIKPLEFKPIHLVKTISWNMKSYVRLETVIKEVRISGVYAVGKNNRMDETIHEPGKQVWFLCDCRSATGATFNILYDGDKEWVPCIMGKWKGGGRQLPRACNNIRPKKNVDLTDMSRLDKMLLDEAIKQFRKDADD